MMILGANPVSQYLSYKKDIDQALEKVLSNGNYILGEEVRTFEGEFSKYVGVDNGVGVGSGTEALHIALKACDIGPGDEVITVSHTAVATAAAITMSGAKPVFVDIEPRFYNMDPNKIQSAISSTTKAIIPVHLYGCPAEIDSILDIAKKNNLKVIEDCSQSHGAKYQGKNVGSFGDLSCFSFYPTKNLGAIGDGGIILSNSKALAAKCRLIREYGWKERYISSIDGINSRLDEIQAAILRVKLKYLDRDNQKRIKIAEHYSELLEISNLKLPEVSSNCLHVYHLFVIRTTIRNELKEYLEANGVFANIQYPVPCHLQPIYQENDSSNNCLLTEKISNEILSLPIYPELSLDAVNKVASLINQFLA